MINTYYRVDFQGNNLLDDIFDYRDEAIKWAEDHISEKPIVIAVDVDVDDYGRSEVIEEEEIFHYPEEEKVLEFDDLDQRLDKLEDDIDHFDESVEEQPLSENIDSDIDSVVAKWESLEEPVVEEEPIEEDLILFDPFGVDFDDVKPVEFEEPRAVAADYEAHPVDFFQDLVRSLGLEDEVEISEKECEDDSCEEKHEDEVKVEDPVAVEDEVKVDVAPEAEVAAEEDIVPEEVKANEEPNVEVQVDDEGIEAPAEEISKCHVCPECGKEICECGNKELVEKNKVTYTTGDPAIGDAHFNGAFEGGEGVSENLEENKVLTDYVQGEMSKGKSAEEVAKTDEFKELAKEEGKKDLEEECSEEHRKNIKDKLVELADEIKAACENPDDQEFDVEGVKVIIAKPIDEKTLANIEVDCAKDFISVIGGYSEDYEDKLVDLICGCEEDLDEAKKNITYTTGSPALNAAHFNGEAGGEGCCEELEEEILPGATIEKLYDSALLTANDTEKPVIYGYQKDGKDNFIDFIVCDDLAKCTKEVEDKYHPTGSVLVAYPDVDVNKINRDEYKPKTYDWDKIKVEDFSEDEMSDEEFAEALKKGLEEKHCKDCKK